ncbi:MAG: DUF1501 domain-containing protein [Tepidisphaeraceae bacterium]
MQKHVSTRRVFLQKGLTLLAVAPTIPTFLDQTVLALAQPLDNSLVQQPSGADGKILVVVQFSGGNDGLSTVVPYADDAYYRARGQIAHPANTVLKINDYIGLNGKLTAFNDLLDQGKLAILQGVGYPNPNRSHFRAMDIWQSAQPERDTPISGWLGRYFDNTCPGCDPKVGVAMGDQLPLAMQGERVMPLSFQRPDAYRYHGADQQHYLALNKADTTAPAAPSSPQPAAGVLSVPKASASNAPITAASQLDFLHRTAMDAQVSSDEILRITKAHQAAGTYPNNEFGNGLRTIAAMIQGGLPTRVYYVALAGFDTHAGQAARHDALMTQLSQGIGAFWADLKTQGNDDRVLMMTFSEFGRRVAANASLGTDHGAAAPMFVMGKGVQNGVIGNHPSLTNLDQGDLRYGIDFRSVYASILQNWLETPSKPILGAQFPTMELVKA